MPRTKGLASKKRKTDDITREMPNSEFRKKEIQVETRFPLVELSKVEDSQWALAFLRDNGYMKIAKPIAEHAYPRLVRLFYQNLNYGARENHELYFEFNVDGHQGTIEEEDMGAIMGLPHEYDPESTPHLGPPLDEPQDEKPFSLLLRQFSEDGKKGTGSSILVSSMPPRVWLLDKILRDNVYPLGHHSERRAEILWALYSAHRGHFFSIPHLAMKGIITMAQDIRSQTATGKKRPLPYGYLISAILDYTNYPFAEREATLPAPPPYDASSWIYKYKTMMNSRESRAKAAAGASSTHATTTTGPSTHTPDTSRPPHDTEVIRRLTRLERHQEELRAQFDDQDHIIRAMARHTLGEEYQEMMDTRPSVLRRGKAAAAEDSDSETEDDQAADDQMDD